MKNTEFTITDIVGQGESSYQNRAWLKVRDKAGFNVAFWGRPRDFHVFRKVLKVLH